MKKLNYHQLREMWLEFYRERGHSVIPSASLVPENDGSVLFTTAGMHPLVPYLLGEKHPAGKRLTNIQKCVRTNDIENVSDNRHCTFLEMMGNWSLGDYFKKEKIAWSFEFITSPKYMGVNKDLISVTCFEGDENAPRDTESAKYWEQAGIPKDRIYFLPKSENWWGLDSGGPCGPCSEMFMDTGKEKCSKNCNPSCDCGKYIEVGNDVFMEYVNADGKITLAKQRNVDTGMGIERMLVMCNGFENIYETEIFAPAIKILGGDCAEARIVAEHIRAAMFIITDGVIPGNTGAGYVLRRLIRRAVRMAKKLSFSNYKAILDTYIEVHGRYYKFDKANIMKVLTDEVAKFEKTLEQGIREFEKVAKYAVDNKLSGKTAFRLYETYGFPIELTQELAKEHGLAINMNEYEEAKVKHAALSTTASAGAFKGGLADTTDATARLHTATHLLLHVLREIYGDVTQKGSNITPERLRFDFNIGHKPENREIAEIERRVNAYIKQNLDVKVQEMPFEQAKQLGAIGSFADRYGTIVKVYSIGNVSCEICGGPHAQNTGTLGTFKIIKEESVSAGVRRIKATLA
jgi:alanyl-tRNA synthetase